MTTTTTVAIVPKKKVCIFGTSADPPTGTTGHVGIVSHLASIPEFDEVWVLPVYQHMYSSKRNRLTPFQNRMDMCKLAFNTDSIHPNNNKVHVYDYEKICYEKKNCCHGNNKTRIGTADLLEWLLLEFLVEEEPVSIEFTLVLGSDSFLDLSQLKWKRSIDIIHLLQGRILVICRKNGTDITDDNNEVIVSSVAKQMNIDHGATIQVLKLDFLSDVSSTIVRNTNDMKLLSNYVTPSVMDYIKRNKLYAFKTDNDSTDNII